MKASLINLLFGIGYAIFWLYSNQIEHLIISQVWITSSTILSEINKNKNY